VVQIWPGQTVTCLHTNSPGHIWTTLYFTDNWRNTCGIRIPNLIKVTFLLFINKCSEYSPHEHVWSWTVAFFQRFLGGCERFDRHFKLELITLRSLSVPTDKNLKCWNRANVEVVPRKTTVRAHLLIWTSVLVLVWGTHSWSLSKYFTYTLYISGPFLCYTINYHCSGRQREWFVKLLV
jgi:hypothetical protein